MRADAATEARNSISMKAVCNAVRNGVPKFNKAPLLRVDPPPCLLLALLPLAVLWEVRDLLKLRSAVTTSACAAGRRQRDAAAATV